MPLAEVAQTGFTDSSAYDYHRPTYPMDAIERFLEVLEIKGREGARILDLGAGTGKLTEILAKRPETYQISAIEPHDQMRAILEKKNLQNVDVLDGIAEDLDFFDDETFDAVAVGQAFHWMANMEALKDIHRVLKPTAVLGMIWNIDDYNAPMSWNIHDGWETTMRDEMHKLDDGHPRFRDMQWQKVFDEQGASNPLSLHASDPLFGLPIGQELFDYCRLLTKDDCWKVLETHSMIANLNHIDTSTLESKFRKAIDSPSTKTHANGKVEMHGKTLIAWASKIPDVPLKSGG